MTQDNDFFDQNDMVPFKPISLKDWAYEQIKRWILDREILPETPLVIRDLENKMKISSTPIRDALLRLEVEGLVQNRPRRGFIVSEITSKDLRNLFELRILIEGYAAKKAATLLKKKDLAELDDLLDSYNLEKRGESTDEFLGADQKFHSLIVNSCNNPMLVQIMDMLQDLTHQEMAIGASSSENMQQSVEEHKKILKAFHQRDGDEACQFMRMHLSAVMKRLLELVDVSDTLRD